MVAKPEVLPKVRPTGRNFMADTKLGRETGVPKVRSTGRNFMADSELGPEFRAGARNSMRRENGVPKVRPTGRTFMADTKLGRRVVLAAVLLVLVSSAGFAQMDMLPQIFRDLPPELQQGLPEQMTFEEYRDLNRNVDFFTMFMSLFVPGYGLFQVEEPDLAWGVVGARFAGYGIMTGAVALQWNHFSDLFQEQALDPPGFQRLLVNSFIFGGGVVVAGLSWAADVVMAYQISKEKKDLVQYTYGLRSSIYGGVRGGSRPDADARYLRRLLTQESEPRLTEKLLADLPRYARTYPDAAFAGEALYYTALLYAERADDPNALRYALRSAYVYPGGDRTSDALRLVARLLERNEQWGIDYEHAAAVARLPAAPDLYARFLAAVRSLQQFEIPALNRAALAEARAFLEQYGGGTLVDEGLAVTAEVLRDLNRPAEAAGYLAAIVVSGPESEDWPAYTLELAELYRGRLSNPERAEILLRALIEAAPDSAEAATAEELLGN